MAAKIQAAVLFCRESERTMQKLAEAVKEYFEDQKIQKGTSLICALSGGADSVGLFLALVRLKEEWNLDLSALHVHHGLRENADMDVEFVKTLSQKYQIPCQVIYVDVKKKIEETGMSTEEAARELRYEAFMTKGKPGALIALAHHRDDQAETMLFNMVRGTGLKGAGGMPQRRDRYIRPLLKLGREEIREELLKEGQSWREDESNQDVQYARNRIRQVVVPELMKINPMAGKHFAELSEQLWEAEEYLEEATKVAMASCVSDGKLEKEAFEKLPEILRKRILLKLLGETAGKQKDLTKEHIRSLLLLMKQQVGKKVSLPYGIEARRTYEGLLLIKEEERNCIKEEPGVILKPGQKVVFGKYIFELRLVSADSAEGREILAKQGSATGREEYFDYEQFTGPISVRTMQPEDKIMVGKNMRQSLKQFFVNQKIASQERKQYPLVCDAQNVLWIPEVRRGYTAYVQKETQQIACVRIISETMVE